MTGARSAEKASVFHSLHLKLVLILVLLVLTVMLVMGTLMVSRVTSYYIDDFLTQMETVFEPRFLSELQESAEADPEQSAVILWNRLYACSAELGLDSDRTAAVLDAEGRVLYPESYSVENTANILRAVGGEVGTSVYAYESYMDVAIPLTVGGTGRILYIRDDCGSLSELKWMLFRVIVQVILFSLGFAVLLSFLLSKTMTRPLENLNRGARRLASGQFQPLTVQSSDEIGALTTSFNTMAATLRDTLETVENERNKLDALFRHMTDGVASFDENGRIMQLNPAAEELLNVRFSQELTFEGLFGEAFSPEELSEDAGTPDERENAGQGVEWICGERYLQLYLARLGAGCMVVIHDVTVQSRMESSRREFVANVSHELRTPLTSIKSYTETLMETPDLPPEMTQRFLSIIVGEADRMTRIVKDLLTLSRLDNGKFELKLTRFPMLDLLSRIYEAMRFEAERRKHTMRLETAPELPFLTADRERIEQVVVNILSNAIKYTPNGGEIVLRGWAEGEKVFVQVQDNGVGIPEADLPRLFERFYRVEKARSRDKGGTGLGLAIASEIVHRHGGQMYVQSQVEVGTIMTVELPLQSE